MEAIIWFTGGAVEPGNKTMDHKNYTANGLIKSSVTSGRISVAHDVKEDTADKDRAIFIAEMKTKAAEMIDVEMDYFYKD